MYNVHQFRKTKKKISKKKTHKKNSKLKSTLQWVVCVCFEHAFSMPFNISIYVIHHKMFQRTMYRNSIQNDCSRDRIFQIETKPNFKITYSNSFVFVLVIFFCFVFVSLKCRKNDVATTNNDLIQFILTFSFCRFSWQLIHIYLFLWIFFFFSLFVSFFIVAYDSPIKNLLWN